MSASSAARQDVTKMTFLAEERPDPGIHCHQVHVGPSRFFFLLGFLGCLFWIARQSNSVGYSKEGGHHNFGAVQI